MFGNYSRFGAAARHTKALQVDLLGDRQRDQNNKRPEEDFLCARICILKRVDRSRNHVYELSHACFQPPLKSWDSLSLAVEAVSAVCKSTGICVEKWIRRGA
jgi:hypothetical protein